MEKTVSYGPLRASPKSKPTAASSSCWGCSLGSGCSKHPSADLRHVSSFLPASARCSGPRMLQLEEGLCRPASGWLPPLLQATPLPASGVAVCLVPA